MDDFVLKFAQLPVAWSGVSLDCAVSTSMIVLSKWCATGELKASIWRRSYTCGYIGDWMRLVFPKNRPELGRVAPGVGPLCSLVRILCENISHMTLLYGRYRDFRSHETIEFWAMWFVINCVRFN